MYTEFVRAGFVRGKAYQLCQCMPVESRPDLIRVACGMWGAYATLCGLRPPGQPLSAYLYPFKVLVKQSDLSILGSIWFVICTIVG